MAIKSTIATTPRIDSDTFVGIQWAGVALSLIFVIFRIYARVRAFRKLYADDFLVIFAWILFCVSSIIWQTQQKAMYAEFELSAGEQPTTSVIAAEKTFLRTEVGPLFLFHTSLWSVKLSFMIFFRRLGQKVTGHRMWWWCVLIFIVVTWVTCIGSIQYWCLFGALDYIFSHCSSGYQLSVYRKFLHYKGAVDVVTDAMSGPFQDIKHGLGNVNLLVVITIPVVMLWNVQISRRRKLALMGLFSLTVFVIMIAIVRVAVLSKTKTHLDITWMYMWSNIEVAVSLIIACLASFRQLFVKSNHANHAVPKDEEKSSWELSIISKYFRSLASKNSSGGKGSFFSRGPRSQKTAHQSLDSAEHIVPLDNIHVSQDINSRSDVLTEGTQMPTPQVKNTAYSTSLGYDCESGWDGAYHGESKKYPHCGYESSTPQV